MTKVIAGLLLSLFALVLLAACTPPLTRGYVYDKQYQPAYTTYIPGYSTKSCSKIGKSTSCYTYYHPSVVDWHPAEYYLKITSCSSLQTDGQCQTGWVDVDQATYDSTRVGSYYPEGSLKARKGGQ